MALAFSKSSCASEELSNNSLPMPENWAPCPGNTNAFIVSWLILGAKIGQAAEKCKKIMAFIAERELSEMQKIVSNGMRNGKKFVILRDFYVILCVYIFYSYG